MEDYTTVVFAFIDQTKPVKEFESWMYETEDLESYFGDDLYIEIIQTSFFDEEEVGRLRERLKFFLAEQKQS